MPLYGSAVSANRVSVVADLPSESAVYTIVNKHLGFLLLISEFVWNAYFC